MRSEMSQRVAEAFLPRSNLDHTSESR